MVLTLYVVTLFLRSVMRSVMHFHSIRTSPWSERLAECNTSSSSEYLNSLVPLKATVILI